MTTPSNATTREPKATWHQLLTRSWIATLLLLCGLGASAADPFGATSAPSRAPRVDLPLTSLSPSELAGGPPPSATSADALVAPEGAPTMPRKLAQDYPAANRDKVEQTFTGLLKSYPDLAKRLDVPPRDLGAAMAGYLAGAWAGYHNKTFPDEWFQPLVHQMRTALAKQPRIAQASAEEKRELHEFFVIQGMFLALTQFQLAKQPNPSTAANIQKLGKANLERFTKVDAEKIRFTSKGMIYALDSRLAPIVDGIK